MKKFSGPVGEVPLGQFSNSARKDLASFRALLWYVPGSDDFALRLDVKAGEFQHNKMLLAGIPSEVPGQSMRKDDPLICPNKGVENALVALVPRTALVAALRELAEKLEEMDETLQRKEED